MDRRNTLKLLAGVMVGMRFTLPQAAWSANAFPQTTNALREARLNERRAYRRYIACAQLANQENYLGIAYLFTALGNSELIHAQNYERVLSVLGYPIEYTTIAEFEATGTKDNLIRCAKAELNSIENFYPSIVERLQEEQHSDALKVIRYSWESHKQHRKMIKKVLKWSPSKFNTVARKIDKNTDKYFVCQICGSTDVGVPEESCPICKNSSESYRLIAPDMFL